MDRCVLATPLALVCGVLGQDEHHVLVIDGRNEALHALSRLDAGANSKRLRQTTLMKSP